MDPQSEGSSKPKRRKRTEPRKVKVTKEDETTTESEVNGKWIRMAVGPPKPTAPECNPSDEEDIESFSSTPDVEAPTRGKRVCFASTRSEEEEVTLIESSTSAASKKPPHQPSKDDLLARSVREVRKFYSVFSKRSEEIVERVYDHHDRQPNQPNYWEFCKMQVKQELGELDQQMATFTQRVEKLRVFLNTRILPPSTYVVYSGHPFKGYPMTQIMDGLERMREYDPDIMGREWSITDFAALKEDLGSKPPPTLKESEENGEDDDSNDPEYTPPSDPKSDILDEKQGVRRQKFNKYHSTVMSLLASDGRFGLKYNPYDFRRLASLKADLRKKYGDQMVLDLDGFITQSYAAYNQIFKKKSPTLFAPLSVGEDVKQHLATFRHLFKARMGDKPLL